MKIEFSGHVQENPQIWNLTKILPAGAELFQADGYTGRRDEANSSFS